MTQPVTKQELIDASADAATLEVVINGAPDEVVESRLGRQYPTLATVGRAVGEATTAVVELESAIEIASAAGAGAAGWTDLLVLTDSGRTQRAKNAESVSVKDFGAKGDGVADDTQAWVNALAYCNSKLRTGLTSNVRHSGATLIVPSGVYNLSSLSAALVVKCDIDCKDALLKIPAAYAGTVFSIGMTDSTVNLSAASISLPEIAKPVSNDALVAGSVGVRVCNLNASILRTRRINYFESGVWLGGIGEGTVYNDIYLGQISYCKRTLVMIPSTGGWCNNNRIFGGNLQQSTGFAGGTRMSGWRHLLIDGRSPATSVVGNTFIGTSFEGEVSEYVFDIKGAYNNLFLNCYHETGTPVRTCTVSGDTITRVGHGLVVGDRLFMGASALPAGMVSDIEVGYYVVSVPTADTFKVSLNKAGSAVTFTSSGTNVFYTRAARFLFDHGGGGAVCFNNRLLNPMVPTSILIDVVEEGQAQNNGVDSPTVSRYAPYGAADMPIFQGCNISGSAPVRPLFAAYAPANNPKTNPCGWAYALSDRGLLAGNRTGGESARVHVSTTTGALRIKYAADSGDGFDISSCTKSPSLIPVTALSCAANGRTLTTITLTGAALGDHLTLTPYDPLPDGIAIAWSRINAANTIQICFYNWTASPISVTCNFQAMASRRFL